MACNTSPHSNRVMTAASSVLREAYAEYPLAYSEVKKASRSYGKNLRALRALAEAKSQKLKSRIEWFLHQPSTKLCGVLLGAWKRHKHLTWTQVVDAAASVNFWAGTDEPVRVDLTIKKSGAIRPIAKFGFKATALQVVILDVLRATTKVPNVEYAAAGKGRNMAIRKIVDCMNATGSRHLVLADVQNFFPSITPEGLAGLTPLPMGVVINALTVRESILQLSPSAEHCLTGDLNTQIRAGIPQGSLTSPYLAAMVMGELTAGLLSEEAGTTYVDDLAIVAKSEEEAEAIKHALLARIQALPIGPLAFKRLEVAKIDGSSKVDFLGYRFRLGADGMVRVTPIPKAIHKFITRLTKKLKAVPYFEVDQFAAKEATQWAAVQDAWDLHEAAMDIFMVQVEGAAIAEKSRQTNFILKQHKEVSALAKLALKSNMPPGNDVPF